MGCVRDIPNCTGCRVGCRIDRYQCGRGERLHALWLAGEELPDVKLGLSPEARVARMLPEAARALEGAVSESAERRALRFLAAHGGFASRRIVEYRVRAEGVVDGLVACGFACEEGGFVRITEEGVARERVWREELDRACSDFCAPLDEAERQQLVDLLFKLRPCR